MLHQQFIVQGIEHSKGFLSLRGKIRLISNYIGSNTDTSLNLSVSDSEMNGFEASLSRKVKSSNAFQSSLFLMQMIEEEEDVG